MNEISSVDASRLSARLVSGDIDEPLLREIVALRHIPSGLVNNMLMILSDTDDARVRNILAITLAGATVPDAARRIKHLVTETKTEGTRATLLYALHQLQSNLDLATLTRMILRDTPEAKEETLILLEDLLEEGVPAPEIQQAIRSIMSHYPPHYPLHPIAADAKDLLEEALAASTAN